MHYLKRPRWALSENAVTDEHLFLNRRQVLAGMGISLGGMALGARGAFAAAGETAIVPTPPLNPSFADAGRAVTDESVTSRYNNFYEFGSSKRIWREAQALQVDPWTITIDGLVEEPFQISFEDLMRDMPLEERIVRLRCVEAWSMVIPWTGFEMRHLLDKARPLSSAKYVRMETFLDPDVAREQRASWWPWPYVEGATIEEAANPLSFMVTGAYGKELHKQFGAPIRLHMPWKYGFKAVKSITRISFTDERPVSFWEELAANEYGFWANVNPAVDHPRWTQATEQPLSGGDRIPTQLFNGYAEEVASLYTGMEAEVGDRLWR
ncbi:MAG: protein-methionine-sulfoxide reductase catalytic subunit MsrP [Pseudomonadota bacterium]